VLFLDVKESVLEVWPDQTARDVRVQMFEVILHFGFGHGIELTNEFVFDDLRVNVALDGSIQID
jgi:hypothetical protein